MSMKMIMLPKHSPRYLARSSRRSLASLCLSPAFFTSEQREEQRGSDGFLGQMASVFPLAPPHLPGLILHGKEDSR